MKSIFVSFQQNYIGREKFIASYKSLYAEILDDRSYKSILSATSYKFPIPSGVTVYSNNIINNSFKDEKKKKKDRQAKKETLNNLFTT